VSLKNITKCSFFNFIVVLILICIIYEHHPSVKMSTCDQICDSVCKLNEVFFKEKHPYPVWEMKKYTKDKDDEFLKLKKKYNRSFMFPCSVPTLQKTEETMNMFYSSKVMQVNPSLAWITYICSSHFSYETGIYPFCSLETERKTELHELNKTLYYLGKDMMEEYPCGEWNTFAMFVYFKPRRLMVTLDMSADIPYICVNRREEYGNRSWRPCYYFFSKKYVETNKS